MPKLTKQDIQDIANGYTVKYVSNSFTKDELIIELAKLCLQAIDEKEDILSQPVEIDEEDRPWLIKLNKAFVKLPVDISGQSMKRICRRLPMQNAVSLARKIGANVLAIHQKITLMAVAQLHVVRK